MAAESTHLDFNALPLEIWRLVVDFLPRRDVASLCLVCKDFLDIYRPVLWRHLEFRWPSTNKRARYDGQRLLQTDFDKKLLSLVLETQLSPKANASWPIFMKKKQRSAFRKRIRSADTFASISLHQLPRQVLVRTMPEWTKHLLLDIANLQSLVLMGPAFLDAVTVAPVLLNSSNLRTLKIVGAVEYGNFQYWYEYGNGHIYIEDTKMFWNKLMSLIASKRGSLGVRGHEPLLRLEELAIDDFAQFDVSALTDLAYLRRLALHDNPDYYSSGRKPAKPEPGVACQFHKALNLSSLTLTCVRPESTELARVLHSRPRSRLTDLSIGRAKESGLTSSKELLRASWRNIELVSGMYLGFDAAELQQMAGILNPSIQELHLRFVGLRDRDKVLSLITHLPNLKRFSLDMGRKRCNPDLTQVHRGMDRFATQLFLFHDSELEEANGCGPSGLQEITIMSEDCFRKHDAGVFTGGREIVTSMKYSKSWGRPGIGKTTEEMLGGARPRGDLGWATESGWMGAMDWSNRMEQSWRIAIDGVIVSRATEHAPATNTVVRV